MWGKLWWSSSDRHSKTFDFKCGRDQNAWEFKRKRKKNAWEVSQIKEKSTRKEIESISSLLRWADLIQTLGRMELKECITWIKQSGIHAWTNLKMLKMSTDLNKHKMKLIFWCIVWDWAEKLVPLSLYTYRQPWTCSPRLIPPWSHHQFHSPHLAESASSPRKGLLASPLVSQCYHLISTISSRKRTLTPRTRPYCFCSCPCCLHCIRCRPVKIVFPEVLWFRLICVHLSLVPFLLLHHSKDESWSHGHATCIHSLLMLSWLKVQMCKTWHLIEVIRFCLQNSLRKSWWKGMSRILDHVISLSTTNTDIWTRKEKPLHQKQENKTDEIQ